MEFSNMYKSFCISIPEAVNDSLISHLIRADEDEDLAFGLWLPSEGENRFTALINQILLPEKDDRQVHGNVSFHVQYFKRVCRIAAEKKMGVCFLHSHPSVGWQSMSIDDLTAERKMAGTVTTLTDLPLVGLTVGRDGTWSGRIWQQQAKSGFKMKLASIVKTIGKRLNAHFCDQLNTKPQYKESFKRTRTVYGKENHEKIARLVIGVVGLGSVGSAVVEMLARMGIQDFILIDFDIIKVHNLDRQLGASRKDIGKLKVDVTKRQIKSASTAQRVRVRTIKQNLSEKAAYNAALDCDVIFSCVDRPLARYILNHIAYAHLIPVIDGGICVSFNQGEFESADWQFQTVRPGMPCLQCLNAYEASDVSLEQSGLLEKPAYIKGLPDHHPLKNNENMFPFSSHLAASEVFHLIALVTGLGGVDVFGVQRYRFKQGYLSSYVDRTCSSSCSFVELIATGDAYLKIVK
jgi:hypothetical protein